MTDRNDARAEGQGRVYQASGDQYIAEHHHYAPDWAGPDTVRRPAVAHPPVVLRDRAGEMDRLRAAVQPGVGNSIYVLHGLGGCGKTAVAYAIFQHATTKAGRVGLWVNASDPASLRAGLLAVAADRGATDAELTGARSGLRPAADLVWHYLDHSDQPWLLVLDNADTPAILRDGGWLRTSPVGTVIVTTRQAGTQWWTGAELLQFGVLPREEAGLILRDLAPHAGTDEEAEAVADRLGRLPLALILAGGFLAHQVIDPRTLADYRRRLDGGAGLDPIELIDQGADAGAGNDPRNLVSRTWQLSLDALRAQGLPGATHLLRLLACWSGDPLPLSVLSGAEMLPDLPAVRVEPALRGLLDQSLTELVPASVRCLRTHQVLLDSVARTIDSNQREPIAAAAARLLLVVLPEVPEHGPQDPRVALLAPHLLAFLRRVATWGLQDSVVEAAAECVLRLVIAIHRSGDYASALTLTGEAVELAAPRLGTDNVFILRLNQRVGCALFRLGRFEESEIVHRRVLEQCERTLGANAPDTLESCRQLGRAIFNLALLDLGQFRDCVALLERAVAGRTELFGKTHPLTLLARADLVEFAIGPGMDGIVATGPEVIADSRRALGEDHRITLQAEHSYASTLIYIGRGREALPYARRVFASYERSLGPDHTGTLSARQALSRALAAAGDYAEAIAHIEAVIERRTIILGPGHPWTSIARERLNEYRQSQSNARLTE